MSLRRFLIGIAVVAAIGAVLGLVTVPSEPRPPGDVDQGSASANHLPVRYPEGIRQAVAPMMELVYISGSKPEVRKDMRVRIPLGAPTTTTRGCSQPGYGKTGRLS